MTSTGSASTSWPHRASSRDGRPRRVDRPAPAGVRGRTRAAVSLRCAPPRLAAVPGVGTLAYGPTGAGAAAAPAALTAAAPARPRRVGRRAALQFRGRRASRRARCGRPAAALGVAAWCGDLADTFPTVAIRVSGAAVAAGCTTGRPSGAAPSRREAIAADLEGSGGRGAPACPSSPTPTARWSTSTASAATSCAPASTAWTAPVAPRHPLARDRQRRRRRRRRLRQAHRVRPGAGRGRLGRPSAVALIFGGRCGHQLVLVSDGWPRSPPRRCALAA